MVRAVVAFLMALCAVVWAGAAVAQGGNYQIQPGDTLSVEVLEDPNLNRQVLILPDGRFSFPLAGTVAAGGRTIGQVERALSSALAPNFTNPPTVFVSVARLSEGDEAQEEADDTLTVYLLGEVNAPGPKSVLPGTTVLQLLSQSGGFTPFAATKRLQLRRTDPDTGAQRLFEIDYRAISRGARIVNEPLLREGDVLLVPERRLFE
jgi:polysaccharide export outer membrane protein